MNKETELRLHAVRWSYVVVDQSVLSLPVMPMASSQAPTIRRRLVLSVRL